MPTFDEAASKAGTVDEQVTLYVHALEAENAQLKSAATFQQEQIDSLTAKLAAASSPSPS